MGFTLESIAILDSHLITGKFSGGGLINAQTLLQLFPSRYSVTYFPKSDTYFALNTNPKLLDNIEKIEKEGLVVSKTFKELWSYNGRYSFRKYRKKLLAGYISEISSIAFVYDNDFYTILHPFTRFKPDIIEICTNSEKSKFGITLRGYSLINFSNNFKLTKLILKNELSSLLHIETLKRNVSFIIHPLFDRHINRIISKCENLQFVGVVSSYLASQNLEISKNKDTFRYLFPSDISQFRSEVEAKPRKDKQLIFFYSRLVPEKGIFEVPKILKEIRNLGHDVNLMIAGEFKYKKDEQTFFRLLNRYGVKEYVIFMGFLNENELKDVLSNSKVLMYPSHSDSFSIALLNSIHLKTKVVAYDLPALKDIYSNLPAVRFVKEYDTNAMALAVSDILKEEEQTYLNSFNNPQTTNFLELTANRNKLFDAISDLIDEALSKSV